MDKPIFSYQDDRFSADTAADCALGVIIGTDGFSALVTNRAGEPLSIRAWHFHGTKRDFQAVEADIRIIFGQENWLRFPFGSVTYAFSNANATLIPRRLFNEEELPAYFKLLIQPADYRYAYDQLPEIDGFLVYAVEEAIVRTAQQYFPQGRRVHLGTALIKAFRQINVRNDYEVMVNLRNQTAQILVFERQNLLFLNTFQFTHPNDLLYSVLLAYNQFRLNPLETPLMLAGNLVEDSDIYRLLYRYVRPLQFAVLPAMNRLPAATGSLPRHCFFDLYALLG